MKSVRQRWYELHRARREFRRLQNERQKQWLLCGHKPSTSEIDRMINPPIIVDLTLPRLV